MAPLSHDKKQYKEDQSILRAFVGHGEEVRTLLAAKHAAASRGERLRPVLLYGPSGCGKTTLARLISTYNEDNRGQGGFLEVASASITEAALVKAIASLARRRKGGSYPTLLIDEIHSLSAKSMELLYPVMDEGKLRWMDSTIDAPISIIATTTDIGALLPPLRNRFMISLYIGEYPEEEMYQIVATYWSANGGTFDQQGVLRAVSLSRGVPRMAISILEAVRDISETLSAEAVDKAAKRLGFLAGGLLPDEWKYITCLYGLDGQASAAVLRGLTGLSKARFQEVEAFLINNGYVTIDQSGRTLKLKAIDLILTVTDQS